MNGTAKEGWNMWSICRVDKHNHKPATLFEVQAAYRKKDLSMSEARKSGFVHHTDELIALSPSGKIVTLKKSQ